MVDRLTWLYLTGYFQTSKGSYSINNGHLIIMMKVVPNPNLHPRDIVAAVNGNAGIKGVVIGDTAVFRNEAAEQLLAKFVEVECDPKLAISGKASEAARKMQEQAHP